MTKVLVLGGTYDHKLLIEKLVKQGYWVVLADYFENPVAKESANEYYQISTLEISALEEVCRELEIKLIFSACVDSSLEPALILSKKLGLAHHFSTEKLPFISNKGLMKTLFSKNKIPTAEFLIIRQNELEKIEGLKFPLVVKPIGTSSSKGVMKIRDSKNGLVAINEAFQLTRGGEVIVEEYVTGEELTVDVWVADGKAQVLMISKIRKSAFNLDQFTINSNLYDPILFKEVFPSVSLIAQSLVDALGYSDGPLLFQMIHGATQFSVLEMSIRMGGGSKVRLVKEVTGVDLLDAYISLYSDKRCQIQATYSDHWAEIVYLYTSNGIIDEFCGFEEAKKEGLIEDFFLYKEKGASTTGSSVSSDRAAGVLMKSKNQENLSEKKSRFFDRVSILDPSGENLLKKWF